MTSNCRVWNVLERFLVIFTDHLELWCSDWAVHNLNQTIHFNSTASKYQIRSISGKNLCDIWDSRRSHRLLERFHLNQTVKFNPTASMCSNFWGILENSSNCEGSFNLMEHTNNLKKSTISKIILDSSGSSDPLKDSLAFGSLQLVGFLRILLDSHQLNIFKLLVFSCFWDQLA